MGLFNEMLKSDESLFKNEIALDYDFLPKLLPYREDKQREVATLIQPLLHEKNGRNGFIYGTPGIGKTAALKFVLRDLEEETDEVMPIYVNCWNKNTTFKIFVEICDQLDFKFTQNKRSEELFKVIKQMVNRKSAVFIFDEIDKIEDFDFLYNILEELYRKSVILITNYKDWINDLDERIRSRLLPEMIEFKEYNAAETSGILRQRATYAFHKDVWDDQAFEIVSGKAAEIKDIRTGLYLMREAGNIAEMASSRKIVEEHAKKAVEKLNQFHSKDNAELTEEEGLILEVVKQHSGKKMGDLFAAYQEKGGQSVYKTFQRKIDKLEKGKYISTKKTDGKGGNTTLVSFGGVKKLTDF